MRKFWLLIPFLGLLLAMQAQGQNNLLPVIPRPQQVWEAGGFSKMSQVALNDEQLLSYPFLQLWLQDRDFYICQVSEKGNVQISFTEDMEEEAYRLQILEEGIEIMAGGTAGLQYAFTTLAQYLDMGMWPLPLVKLEDAPQFSYRGMHLDVARHFFSVEEVKRYLDYMAYYKFNHFHWHLTEDQGWRIEIKKYPLLQEIAAWRKETLIGHYNEQPVRYDGQRYGGYYTQEEVKSIVAYAAERHITIVPEIEMPGHSLAALAAYPELGCTGGPYEVGTTWGIFEEVYCPKESTFTFLEDVLTEVMELFPGPYIHIGGDECPKASWKACAFCQALMKEKGLKNEEELQSYFISRMASFLQSKGRKVIGWDEILEGGLAKDAIVMSWRGVEGALEAAHLGHHAIMTPGSHCYFDHYQSEDPDEPVAIGGYTSVEKVYHWNPIPESLDSSLHHFIKGGQANVWTEYIPHFDQVTYMAYARGMAMAEVLWSGTGDYKDFVNRFLKHHKYWTERGSKVAMHIFELKPRISQGPVFSFSMPEGVEIHAYLNEELVKTFDAAASFPATVSGTYAFVPYVHGEAYKGRSFEVELHKGTQAQIEIPGGLSPHYKGQGEVSLINGIKGSDHKFGGSEWLGFSGKNVDIILSWEKTEVLNEVNMRFFKAEGQWIYLPVRVGVYSLKEDGIWTLEGHFPVPDTDTNVSELKIPMQASTHQKLKFSVEHYGIIPDGAQGAGHGAWLFIDEIVVR